MLRVPLSAARRCRHSPPAPAGAALGLPRSSGGGPCGGRRISSRSAPPARLRGTRPSPAAPPHTLRKPSDSGTTRLPSSSFRKAAPLRRRTRYPQARSSGRARTPAGSWTSESPPNLPPFPVLLPTRRRRCGKCMAPVWPFRTLPFSPGPRTAVGAPRLTRPHPASCPGGGREIRPSERGSRPPLARWRVTRTPRPGRPRPLRPLERPAPLSPSVPTPPAGHTRTDSG